MILAHDIGSDTDRGVQSSIVCVCWRDHLTVTIYYSITVGINTGREIEIGRQECQDNTMDKIAELNRMWESIATPQETSEEYLNEIYQE